MLFVIGIALCFALSYLAELIGLANIIGAFAAGVLLDPYGTDIRTNADDATLRELLVPLSELLVPLFFVLMGLQVDRSSLLEPFCDGFGNDANHRRHHREIGLRTGCRRARHPPLSRRSA
jgi:Kef-type K+ transport system membrane component KefB